MDVHPSIPSSVHPLMASYILLRWAPSSMWCSYRALLFLLLSFFCQPLCNFYMTADYPRVIAWPLVVLVAAGFIFGFRQVFVSWELFVFKQCDLVAYMTSHGSNECGKMRGESEQSLTSHSSTNFKNLGAGERLRTRLCCGTLGLILGRFEFWLV